VEELLLYRMMSAVSTYSVIEFLIQQLCHLSRWVWSVLCTTNTWGVIFLPIRLLKNRRIREHEM